MIRASKRPLRPSVIKYPSAIEREIDDEFATVSHRKKKIKNHLSWRKALKACRIIRKQKMKSKKSYLRLSCHPNSTLSVKQIENIIRGWERDGWIPDVVVVDYVDILNMDSSGVEGRDRINETWKQLRRLNQTFHCLVVTGTQANADSYSAKTQDMSNFSEDKRKYAHVTATIAINQTNEEKDNGVCRLNYIVRREEAFLSNRCVHVAGSQEIYNPAIKSTW